MINRHVKSKNKTFNIVLMILIAFEIFEFDLMVRGVVTTESTINQILDVVVGVSGARLARDKKI